MAHPDAPRGTLYTDDLVSVVLAGSVERTRVEAFSGWDGTPLTPRFDKMRVRVRADNENIRWARGHVDEDGAAALLAASALSGNAVADINGVRYGFTHTRSAIKS